MGVDAEEKGATAGVNEEGMYVTVKIFCKGWIIYLLTQRTNNFRMRKHCSILVDPGGGGWYRGYTGKS